MKLIEKRVDKYFLMLAVIFSAIVFLILSSSLSAKYVAETQILISPKNEKTAIYLKSINKNLVEIFTKTQEETDVKITEIEGSSLLLVEATDKTGFRSLEKTKQAVREFLDIASRYYNIDTDLNFRIVDVDVFQKKNNLFLPILISIFLGSLLALAIQPIINLIGRMIANSAHKRTASKFDIAGRSNLQNILEDSGDKIRELSREDNGNNDIDKFAEKFPDIEHSDDIIEPLPEEYQIVEEYSDEKKPNKKSKIGSINKKSNPPRNLPIFPEQEENSTVGSFSQKVLNKRATYHEEPMATEETIINSSEPTEEEYKKRLNELLRGEN